MGIDISQSDISLFQSQDRLELLNDIDKFRQDGLANLPQIVVCGDTSSGKSSVLEALSGIPFPVDGTICTRFATEIALRYSLDERVTGEASISPAPGASESHRARLAEFPRTIASLEAIPDIIQNAKQSMMLGEAAGISRDVLHLSIHGNILPNLTLIDLPGLIHAATNSDDIKNVQTLVEHYFKQEESLILTVVSAENPIENQAILTLSQRFDPMGARSIGVITKPDVLKRPDKARLANSVMELARNQHTGFKFKRGWQIIRCLTDDERQEHADRDEIESKLFGQRPWNTFNRKQLGTKALRAVLCEYLAEHIIRLLPELSKSLDEKIVAVKSSLLGLGPHRATHNERIQHLIRLSGRFGQLVHDALTGDYSDSFFHGSESTTRLRATTMTFADDFERVMRTQGHMFEVTDCNQSSKPPNKPPIVSIHDALIKVGELMDKFRGPELPLLLNPRLVGELFKHQSQKWDTMAREYTQRICRVIQVFLRNLLDFMCPSTGRTTELLLRHVFDDALHSHQQKLEQKIDELFAPYNSPFLFSTKRRLQASMNEVELGPDIEDTSSDPRLKLLHCSIAYYNVALETFIDNVVLLGVESCLLTKLRDIFSPETVAQMTEEMVYLLGGESTDIVTERRELNAQLVTLEQALKNCRRHASREIGIERENVSVPSPDIATTPSGSASIIRNLNESARAVLDVAEQPSVSSDPVLATQPTTQLGGRSPRPHVLPDVNKPDPVTPKVAHGIVTPASSAKSAPINSNLESSSPFASSHKSKDGLSSDAKNLYGQAVRSLATQPTSSGLSVDAIDQSTTLPGSTPRVTANHVARKGGFGSSSPHPQVEGVFGSTVNSAAHSGGGPSTFGGFGSPSPLPENAKGFRFAVPTLGLGNPCATIPKDSVTGTNPFTFNRPSTKFPVERQRVLLPKFREEEVASATLSRDLVEEFRYGLPTQLFPTFHDENFVCDVRARSSNSPVWRKELSFEELRLNTYNLIWSQRTKKFVSIWLSRQSTESEAMSSSRGSCTYPAYLDFVEKAIWAATSSFREGWQ